MARDEVPIERWYEIGRGEQGERRYSLASDGSTQPWVGRAEARRTSAVAGRRAVLVDTNQWCAVCGTVPEFLDDASRAWFRAHRECQSCVEQPRLF